MTAQFKSLIALVALALVACGGAEDDQAASSIQTLGLSMQAAPYLNAMPQVILTPQPGGTPTCTELIVPFVVRSAKGAVPAALTAGKITLVDAASNKVLWSADSSATVLDKMVTKDDALSGYPLQPRAPNTFSESVLQGVARGCANGETGIDKTVVVRVDVLLDRQTAPLSAVAKIYVTY